MAKLRFAPSPTGNLHIGSLRTAIFNWIWAKSIGADLVLRIEDTDLERSKPEYEQTIMDGLNWLGITFDEGPLHTKNGGLYRQSERLRACVYDAYIHQLLATGAAYYCFETDEELDQERAHAEAAGIPYKYSRKSLALSKADVAQRLHDGHAHTIRFRVPDNVTVIVTDVIRGEISFDASLISDFIIVKSDGSPTYNLAVVIDDMDMNITHVVRGEDHISNTPKQQLIFEALGAEVPIFAHLPIILGPDRSKLSKRHGATSVIEYQNLGILPSAMINYLSLLGYTPKDGQEVFSQSELIDEFDVSRINKSGAIFDIVKLQWMNKQHVMGLSNDAFLDVIKPYVSMAFSDSNMNAQLMSIRDNIHVLSDVNEALRVYYLSLSEFQQRIAEMNWSDTDGLVIQMARDWVLNATTWSSDSVHQMIDHIMTTLSVSKGSVMKPIRQSMTGYHSGPNLVDCLTLIGYAVVYDRLVNHVKTPG